MAKKSKPSANNALQTAQSAPADLSQLERMLAFMEQHGLEEIEYEHAGLRVRLRKPSTNTHHAGASPRSFGGGALVPPEILVAGGAGPAAEAPAGSRGEPSGTAAAEGPSPGAAPFVKVGDQVTSGQVLCIIEAMKLMNEIESDAAGEIVRRYVENGQPVEYGESLFAIRTSRKK